MTFQFDMLTVLDMKSCVKYPPTLPPCAMHTAQCSYMVAIMGGYRGFAEKLNLESKSEILTMSRGIQESE